MLDDMISCVVQSSPVERLRVSRARVARQVARLARVPNLPAPHPRPTSLSPTLCVWLCQELRATNETLRTLQMQLEKAIHTPSPSSSTYKAIMETKDARIATLEKEVALLEREIQRAMLRESGSSLYLATLGSPLVSAPPPPLPMVPSLPLSLAMPLHMHLPPLPPLPAPITTPVPKHTDTSFKRQVSFLLNNVQIRKDGKVSVIM